MQASYIVSAQRTAIASYGGSLQKLSAPELGSQAIKAALVKSGLNADQVQELIMGNVLSAGLGQSPARQAALGAGLPDSVGVLTINKVCSSGLRAISLADQLIKAGDAGICIAGGMESMSNAPYLLPKARFGYRLGDGKLVDSMVHDGLWDPYGNVHMGTVAEKCAAEYKFTREAQDEFATQSYQKAQAAIQSGVFKDEICPVVIKNKKGDITFDTDEEAGKVNFDKLSKIPTVFAKDGTITAANASSLSDGAAALTIVSEAELKANNLTPLAKIVSHASHSQTPDWFTTAPIQAAKNALEKANLTTSDIDLFEINEAFSCVSLAAIRDLELNPDQVNVNGGAVALGHPIGASGARIVVTLAHALKAKGLKRGLAALCNGGGEATSLIIETV